MPPEVPHYRSLATPLVKPSPPSSPESQFNLPVGRKYFRASKSMAIPGRKLILYAVFILASISILRLLRIAITTSSSAPPLPALPPALHHACSTPSPACDKAPSHTPRSQTVQQKISAEAPSLTKKEYELLSDLIKRKAPCNLLVFGAEPQYLKLSSINSGGTTIFLEDDPDKIRKKVLGMESWWCVCIGRFIGHLVPGKAGVAVMAQVLFLSVLLRSSPDMSALISEFGSGVNSSAAFDDAIGKTGQFDSQDGIALGNYLMINWVFPMDTEFHDLLWIQRGQWKWKIARATLCPSDKFFGRRYFSWRIAGSNCHRTSVRYKQGREC